jgi:glutathione peroxidase
MTIPLEQIPLEQIPLKTVDGRDARLGDYAGKVRLVVNVASKCGLTPQYEKLEALYRGYHARGLEVLAFPANEFGGQEPGTEAEIKDFCQTTYDVTFPLFAKIVVKGAGQHPLYSALTHALPEARTLPGTDFRGKLIGYGIEPGGPGEILWNFEKFLLDRDGKVIERFAPDVPPDAPIVVEAIERALASTAR